MACLQRWCSTPRPRCPYSFRLRRKLRRRGLPFREVNIWRDAAAAAAVRAAAGGNETVPTFRWATAGWSTRRSKRSAPRLAMTCGATGDRTAASQVTKAQWCIADLPGMTR
jgi:glutaredoxin